MLPYARKGNLLLLAAILIKLLLSQLAYHRAGYLGDEFLHMEAGKHLAAGYLDFPPMIGFLAFLQNLFHSESIHINHLFSSMAGALILVFSVLMVRELGGKFKAELITILCLLLSPGFMGSQHLFFPSLFEQMFGIIAIYQVVCFYKRGRNLHLLLFFFFAALGFLSKYSMGFVLAGLGLSVLLLHRPLLKNPYLWLGILLFLLVISPNIWWQYSQQFPVFKHFGALYDTQLNRLSLGEELKTLVLFLNPVAMVLWASALLIIPFLKYLKKYRVLTAGLLISFLLMLLARGKFYYYLPIVLGLIPLSAVYAEHLLSKQRTLLYLYLLLLGLTGIFLLPHGLPVLKLENYIRWYGLEQNEDHKIPLTFDHYYSNRIWPQIVDSVRETYEDLDPEEQAACLIWGRHYSYAGAMNLYGQKYSFPAAFSFHSSCFHWVPDFPRNTTIIAIGESNWTRRNYLRFFEEVQEIAVIENPYATEPAWYNHRIFLCRGSRYSSEEFREIFREDIY